MDKLGCTLHYKQDILIFVFAGWLENSLFQGQNNVLKLSQRLKQEAYIFRKSMCKWCVQVGEKVEDPCCPLGEMS